MIDKLKTTLMIHIFTLSASEGFNYVDPVTISLYKAYFNVGFSFYLF